MKVINGFSIMNFSLQQFSQTLLSTTTASNFIIKECLPFYMNSYVYRSLFFVIDLHLCIMHF